MKLKISMTVQNVRQACIDNNYYTCGTIEEYDNMFKLVEQEATVEIIHSIAHDIKQPSETSDSVEMIATAILNKCHVYIG
jgi:predicted DNA-binding protein YlxM (UPF0122 family)